MKRVTVSQSFSAKLSSIKQYSGKNPSFDRFFVAFELGTRQHAGQLQRFVTVPNRDDAVQVKTYNCLWRRTDGPVSSSIRWESAGAFFPLARFNCASRDERSSVFFVSGLNRYLTSHV